MKLTIDNYIQIGLLIITLVSVVSPTIATILNNIHDTKIKKLQKDIDIKQEILREFSQNIVYLHGYETAGTEFYKYLNLLNIYFDVDNELLDHIMNTNYSSQKEFQKDVTKFIKKISIQVKSNK